MTEGPSAASTPESTSHSASYPELTVVHRVLQQLITLPELGPAELDANMFELLDLTMCGHRDAWSILSPNQLLLPPAVWAKLAGSAWEGDNEHRSWKAAALHFVAKNWTPSLASALLEEATLQLQLKSHIHPEKCGTLLTDVICRFLLPNFTPPLAPHRIDDQEPSPHHRNACRTQHQIEHVKRLPMNTRSKRKKSVALTPSPVQRHKKRFPASCASNRATSLSEKDEDEQHAADSQNHRIAVCDWGPEAVASIVARYTYGWDTVDIARVVNMLLLHARDVNCGGSNKAFDGIVFLSELSKNSLFTWGRNNRFIHLLHHMKLGHVQCAEYINSIQHREGWDVQAAVDAATMLGSFFVSFRDCVGFYGSLVASWQPAWIDTLWEVHVERGNLVQTKTPYEIIDLHRTLFSQRNALVGSKSKVGLRHCVNSLQLLDPSSERFDEILAREITTVYKYQQQNNNLMTAMAVQRELQDSQVAPRTPPPSVLNRCAAKSPLKHSGILNFEHCLMASSKENANINRL